MKNKRRGKMIIPHSSVKFEDGKEDRIMYKRL